MSNKKNKKKKTISGTTTKMSTQKQKQKNNNNTNNNNIKDSYDTIIIGSGPAGLATLSAIQEAYSLDHLSADQVHRAARHLPGSKCRGSSVLVVDPHMNAPPSSGASSSSSQGEESDEGDAAEVGWLASWKENFKALDIQFLRSPVMAHCDMFDTNSLLAYAQQQQQQQQQHTPMMIESGCASLKSLIPLGQSQVGLWKLPSSKLFENFCQGLSQRLPHDYHRGHVVDIHKEGDSHISSHKEEEDNSESSSDSSDSEEEEEDGGSAPLFVVTMSDGLTVKATSVVLAMGTIGKPVVPKALTSLWSSDASSSSSSSNSNTSNNNNTRRMISWTQLPQEFKAIANGEKPMWKKALVIGGGLTAVQAAQRIANFTTTSTSTRKSSSSSSSSSCQPPQVTLCSRRPLVERHFDLSIDWFDRRTSNKCMSDFYHQPHELRLKLLKETRGGGSIPAIYMKSLRQLQKQGKIKRVVGNVELIQQEEQQQQEDDCDGIEICIHGLDFQANNNQQQQQNQHYCYQDKFDIIVLACGIQPDCQQSPLIRRLLKRWPIPIRGGFPQLQKNDDLEWTNRLHVVGGLGSLSIGPDAANLMGMRRAAQIVANALECRCWLRQSDVLKNPFDALAGTDESSSDEEEEED